MARNRDLAKIPFETLGGTTGQLLAKTSNTDYDFEWINNTTSTIEHNVKAGEKINKGQAVYVSSADGTNMIVVLADNLTEATSSKTLGLCKQDLANNGQGLIITEGLLTGSGGAVLNTGSANAGDPVWLGESGNLIFGLLNKPYAPKHLVFIGIVTRAHSVNGEIFVKIQNGFELKELHDVQAQTPALKDTLYYDSVDKQWKAGSIPSILGNAGGDLTGTYPSPTIAASVVSLSKMSNLLANSIIGNNTGSAATPIALTPNKVTEMLDSYVGTVKGLVPASGGGTTNFLREDGQWAAGNSGTVTSVGALTLGTSGTDLSSTIANGTTTPVITLNVPDASATARGVVTTGAQSIAGAKTFSSALTALSLIKTGGTSAQILAADGSIITAGTNVTISGGLISASGSGGSAGDYLSTLTGVEIGITTTATATISRQHLISGSTADYIVTLPAVSGNTGKFIGIRISTSATRLFTIKGNASELIDGVNTRIMWKGETAILYCDGTGWKKMAGVSIPMTCQMYQTSVNTTLFLNNTDTKVPITGIKVNNTGFMANTGSQRIDIKRGSIYSLKGAVSYNNFSANSARALTQLRVNAASVCNSDCSALIGSYATPFATTDLTLNLNDYVELWGLQTSGATQGVWGHATIVATMILATEITTW